MILGLIKTHKLSKLSFASRFTFGSKYNYKTTVPLINNSPIIYADRKYMKNKFKIKFPLSFCMLPAIITTSINMFNGWCQGGTILNVIFIIVGMMMYKFGIIYQGKYVLSIQLDRQNSRTMHITVSKNPTIQYFVNKKIFNILILQRMRKQQQYQLNGIYIPSILNYDTDKMSDKQQLDFKIKMVDYQAKFYRIQVKQDQIAKVRYQVPQQQLEQLQSDKKQMQFGEFRDKYCDKNIIIQLLAPLSQKQIQNQSKIMLIVTRQTSAIDCDYLDRLIYGQEISIEFKQSFGV